MMICYCYFALSFLLLCFSLNIFWWIFFSLIYCRGGLLFANSLSFCMSRGPLFLLIWRRVLHDIIFLAGSFYVWVFHTLFHILFACKFSDKKSDVSLTSDPTPPFWRREQMDSLTCAAKGKEAVSKRGEDGQNECPVVLLHSGINDRSGWLVLGGFWLTIQISCSGHHLSVL